MKRFIIFALAFALLLALLAGCANVPANNSNGSTVPVNNDSGNVPSNNNSGSVPANNDSGNVEPNPSGNDPEPFSYDHAEWFCPFNVDPQNDSPAKLINIKTGEVLVACTDPLCNHSSNSETCFFNKSKDGTTLYAVAYYTGHIFFVAEKKTSDGKIMKLYDYDLDNNRIDEVYTYDFIDTQVQLYSNDKMVFFTAFTEEGESILESKIGLFSYDPESKAVKLIDGDALYTLDRSNIAFFNDHYVYGSGYDQEKDRIIYTKRFFDGSNEETFNSLPDGTPMEIFGWQLKSSGLFANTEPNGGVYIEETGSRLTYPTDRATTYPVRYKDNFYFQTRATEATSFGKYPDTNIDIMGYKYDNELYVMNVDGSYKHYSIGSEYHFIIAAVYENTVIGQIRYKVGENGGYVTSQLPDFIHIDLDTGETTIYDTSRRNGFVFTRTTVEVTLNEN